MKADYAVIRFSDSEWRRILKAGGLVVFGASCGPVWYCSLTCTNLYWKMLFIY